LRRHRAIWPAVKVLAFLLVIAALFLVFRRIGFRDVLDAVKGIPGVSIRSALLLHFAAFVLRAFRLQLLMKREQRGSIAILLPIHMAGVFGNTVTPGARVGGEPIRAYYMSKAFGGEKSSHLGTILVDKVGNGLVFLGFLLASVTFVLLFVPLPVAPRIVLAAAILLVAGAVVSGFMLRRKIGLRRPLLAKLLSAAYGNRLLAFLRHRFPTYQLFEQYAIRKLGNVFAPLRQAAVSPKALSKVILMSAASWLVFALAHYVLFRGLGAEISFLKVVVVITIATLFSDVSVSPAGAGFAEAAMMAMCTAFRVDADTAAAVTLISRAIVYLAGLGVGGACLAVLACIYGRTR
jgi:uncharacterized protein (TIRG00374 family)